MRRTDAQGRPRRGWRRRDGDEPSLQDRFEAEFTPRMAADDEESGPQGRGHRGHGPRGHGPGGPGGRWGAGPGWGGGPGWAGGWGPGGPGAGRGRRHGGRGRPRGDVRAAILLLLDEGPRHGYQIIQDIAERSNGAWTPSAGSVYPTLQALEDEGLVVVEPVAGRKTASLTEAGRAHVEAQRERLGTPWQSAADGDDDVHAMRESMVSLAEAVRQVARVGTTEQRAAATARLAETRTALYRILAEEPDGEQG